MTTTSCPQPPAQSGLSPEAVPYAGHRGPKAADQRTSVVVGVTQRCQPPTEPGESRDALDVCWPRFLAACGIMPVPLPNVPGLAVDVAETVGAQGILLTGGDDLG